MLIVSVTRGDDREGLLMQVKRNGAPLDLTGCTVKFYMPPKVPEAFVQVLDPEQGLILLPLEASAVDDVGEFQFQIKVFWPDGRKITLPHGHRIVLAVLPDLTGRSES